MAGEKCLEILETLCCHTVKDVKDAESVIPIIRTSVASKQDGYEDFLAELISDACGKCLRLYHNYSLIWRNILGTKKPENIIC